MRAVGFQELRTGFYSVAVIIRSEQNPDIIFHPLDCLDLLLKGKQAY
jgi:hypothetical protein